MILSLLRSLKVRQIGQIQMHVIINGTATTPVASGPDASFVSAVQKIATGQYRITFRDREKSNLLPSSIVSLSTSRTGIYNASDTESVTLLTMLVLLLMPIFLFRFNSSISFHISFN